MKATDYPIVDFFNRYPDAEAVHEVSDQLFHDNAKDAAEARAKYYGLEIVTFANPKKAPQPPKGVIEMPKTIRSFKRYAL